MTLAVGLVEPGCVVADEMVSGPKTSEGIVLLKGLIASKVKYVSFAIITKFTPSLRHGILMSARQIIALFNPLESEALAAPRYVQIARNVYRVIVGEHPEESEFIGVSSCQISDCSDAIIRLDAKQLMQIYPFEKKDRFPAKAITLKVSSESLAIIEFESLRKLVQSYLVGDFLRVGQNFELSHLLKSYSFKIQGVVQNEHLVSAESDPIERIDLLNRNDFSMGYVDEETDFQFSVLSDSQVCIVNNLLKETEGWKYVFNLMMQPCLSELTPMFQISKVVDLAKIGEEIKKRKYWVQGLTTEVLVASLPYEISLTKIKNASGKRHNMDENLYPSCFEIGESAELVIKFPSSIVVINSNVEPKVASAITLKIIKCKSEKKDDFLQIIDVEDLAMKIGWCGNPLVLVGENFKFNDRENHYAFEVVSVLDEEGSLHLKKTGINPRWKVGTDCKIEFIYNSLSIALVEGSKIFRIKKVCLELSRVEIALGSELKIDEDKLKELIAHQMPREVVSNTIFNVTLYQAGQQIRIFFKVKSLEFDPSEIESSSYQKLGLFSHETNIEIISPNSIENKSFEIIKETIGPEGLGVPEFCNLGIGGLSQLVKQRLHSIKLSINPEMKEEMIKRGMKPSKGLLLYGPPGTGKTSLAREISKILGYKKSNVHFYNGPEFLKKFLGETEGMIRSMFAVADKGGQHAIIIDEIDAIACERTSSELTPSCMRSIIEQFLVEMDGFKSRDNLIVIGLTNRLDEIDSALLRPGRFDTLLEIGLPDEEGRNEILEIYIKKLKDESLLADNVDLKHWAKLSGGFSGADIKEMVNEASSYSLQRIYTMKPEDRATSDYRMVTQDDFSEAFDRQKGRGMREMQYKLARGAGGGSGAGGS